MFTRYLHVPSKPSGVLGGNQYIHCLSTRCHNGREGMRGGTKVLMMIEMEGWDYSVMLGNVTLGGDYICMLVRMCGSFGGGIGKVGIYLLKK